MLLGAFCALYRNIGAASHSFYTRSGSLHLTFAILLLTQDLIEVFFLLKESLLFAVLLFGGFGSGIPSFANRLLITNLLEKCLTGNSVTLQMVSVPSGHLLDLFLTL